jgi:Domain of unknown function (DUF4174)
MRSYLGIACIIAMIQLVEITPMSAREAPLLGYRWENRLLLVFAPDADGGRLRRQREILLVAEPGLNERDMIIIFIIGDAVSIKGPPAAPVTAVDLRNAYGVLPHQFRAVLIGKDGGVKLRQEQPVSVADLFALIDSMPMRRQEMRKSSE